MDKDFDRFTKMPKNFCMIPFIHMAIDCNGDFKPCFIAEPFKLDTGKSANINFIPMDEFAKSKAVADFKDSFRNNERNVLCSKCWETDDQNGESHRKRFIMFFMRSRGWKNEATQKLFDLMQLYFKDRDLYKDDEEFAADKDKPSVDWGQIQDEIDNFNTPIDLEIEPGTTCNFKCLICGPYASSSWQAEYKILYGDKLMSPDGISSVSTPTKLGHWALDSSLWESEVMYNAKKFHFLGGEPMLIQPHFKFLRRLSERNDANSITINYNTNTSTLPSIEIFSEVYPKFRAIKVAFSIDNIGEKFHYQRYPGTWDDALKNMSVWVKSIPNNIEAKIDPAWSILNILNMAELFLWADKFKKEHDLTSVQLAFDGHYYYGNYYCPQTLKPEQKELFKIKMTRDINLLRYSNLSESLMKRAEIVYENLLHHIFIADKWNEEVEKNRVYRFLTLDKVRKQNLKEIQPELNSILKIYD